MDLVMFMKSLKETRANTIYETIVIDSTDPENEIEKILNKEKVLEDKVKTFSIKNGRSGEIKITRRGKLRFLLYRILKRTNDIPLIGARIRRVYILMKNN
jgi:hypothetical protein